MSKVAAYLQEHIQGRVSTNTAVLKAASIDGSILTFTPEMVIYPKITNDIRKVARFSWQLAEKGHILPLTARGYGNDQTGAAIGAGAVIILPTYMNSVFEFDPKQKLVRVQPGVNAKALNDALLLQGVSIPSLSSSPANSTVGGAVANGARDVFSGQYGGISEWTHQLEVILSSGDVLQTGRISRHELSKKKGKQTFEGEIYRSIDTLIEDNKQMIDEKLGGTTPDNAGYSSIAKVKRHDGSFDLTPLIVGSQGTLGIISEMIMKVEFMSSHKGVVLASFDSHEAARDSIDHLKELRPSSLEYFDSTLFTIASAQGKKYDFNKEPGDSSKWVVLAIFDDFNDRANTKKLKKATKLLESTASSITTETNEEASELTAVRDVTSYLLTPSEKDLFAPALFDGIYMPGERFEDFSKSVATLATKHGVTLPLYRRELEGIVFTRPLLHTNKVGDKQKLFKLLGEYSQLVVQCGGSLIAQDGEGRIKAHFSFDALDEDVIALFDAIKKVFDPYGLLNPGVKQPGELRDVMSHLRTDFDTTSNATHLVSF